MPGSSRKSTVLKAIKKTFSLKFRDRLLVCLPNSRMPQALRKRVQPRIFCCFACWVDRLAEHKPG